MQYWAERIKFFVVSCKYDTELIYFCGNSFIGYLSLKILSRASFIANNNTRSVKLEITLLILLFPIFIITFYVAL